MTFVEVATALGRFTLDIREDAAPASAGYFLADVRAGLYDGSSFFRIVTLANHQTEPGRRIEVIRNTGHWARDNVDGLRRLKWQYCWCPWPLRYPMLRKIRS